MLLENKSGTFSNSVVSNHKNPIKAIINIAMTVSFLFNSAPRLLGAFFLVDIFLKTSDLILFN